MLPIISSVLPNKHVPHHHRYHKLFNTMRKLAIAVWATWQLSSAKTTPKSLLQSQTKPQTHATASSLTNDPLMGIASPNALCTEPQSQSHINLARTTTDWPRICSKRALTVQVHLGTWVQLGIQYQLGHSPAYSKAQVWHKEISYFPHRVNVGSHVWPINNFEQTGRHCTCLSAYI